MPIFFSCPKCAAALEWGDDAADSRVRCPHCRRFITVPGDTEDNLVELEVSSPKSSGKPTPPKRPGSHFLVFAVCATIGLIGLCAIAFLAVWASRPVTPTSATKSEVVELVTKGNRARQDADYDLAISCFNKAIAIDPNYPRAFVGRGICYNRKHLHDLAIHDFSEAIRLDPSSGEAYALRANEYAEDENGFRAILDAQEAGKHGEDEKAILKAVAKTLGEKADQQSGSKCLALYSRAVDAEPANVVWRMKRGAAYHDNGSYDDAIADFKKAVELGWEANRAAPYIAKCYFGKASIHRSSGRQAEAAADYQEAVRLDPSYTKFATLFK